MPAGAPALTPGVWTDITPAGIPKGNPNDIISVGLALDPCNRGTLYWANTPFDVPKGGLYKTVDGGSHWTEVVGSASTTDTTTTHFDQPQRVRVDPNDPKHLYVVDGVRLSNTMSTMGFWISFDGGVNWARPKNWAAVQAAVGGFIDDLYDIAVDPADFNHVLVSSHSPWTWGEGTKYGIPNGGNAGVLESKDGGQTWIVHDPQPTWGAGHSINFLYDPAKKIGNSSTWLLGTQSNGQWRTENSGATWTKVSNSDIFHGGGETYYSRTGVLYSAAVPRILRSTDNGKTWTEVGPSAGYTAIWGDGTTLYTTPAYGFGAQPMLVSPETDGTTWTSYGSGQQTWVDGGPYEMTFDAVNGILYSSNWFQGLWALKVKAP
jgi:hypothetical protein